MCSEPRESKTTQKTCGLRIGQVEYGAHATYMHDPSWSKPLPCGSCVRQRRQTRNCRPRPVPGPISKATSLGFSSAAFRILSTMPGFLSKCWPRGFERQDVDRCGRGRGIQLSETDRQTNKQTNKQANEQAKKTKQKKQKNRFAVLYLSYM